MHTHTRTSPPALRATKKGQRSLTSPTTNTSKWPIYFRSCRDTPRAEQHTQGRHTTQPHSVLHRLACCGVMHPATAACFIRTHADPFVQYHPPPSPRSVSAIWTPPLQTVTPTGHAKHILHTGSCIDKTDAGPMGRCTAKLAHTGGKEAGWGSTRKIQRTAKRSPR